MTDTIERTVIHGFNNLGLFKVDAALRSLTNAIPVLGPAFNDAIDGLGISNKAQLEKYNRENPYDQIENPYLTNGSHSVANNDNCVVAVVTAEETVEKPTLSEVA